MTPQVVACLVVVLQCRQMVCIYMTVVGERREEKRREEFDQY